MNSLELLTAGAGLLSLLTIVVLYRRLTTLEARFSRALGGSKNSHELETTLKNSFEKLNITEQKIEKMLQSYQQLSDITAGAVTKIGLVRFSPFRDTGGDQSFVLALLNNHDSGIVLTSIHARDGTRMYVKPISYGSSEHQLSSEEKKAVQSAIEKLSTKPKGRKPSKSKSRS